MPRYSANHVPTYRLHKQSGQAVVTIGGRDKLLGPYDTPASREAYNQRVAEWFAVGRSPAALEARQDAAAAPEGVNVEQVIAAFWKHAQTHYRRKDGQATGEAENFLPSLRVLRKLYGTTPAAAFNARALKACRAEMVAADLCRNVVNRRVGRIRQVFKWAADEELVPTPTYDSLRTVTGLQEGRSPARETDDVQPASDEQVRAAIAHASPHVATMIELQWITGMRPSELLEIKTGEIDRKPKTWEYRPAWHKTAHRGHLRVVYFGERCQELLKSFLKMDPAAYLFSPAEADADRRDRLSRTRKTPRSCGNRPGTNRREKPRRQPGVKYTTDSYAVAIAKACDRAFPPPAHLNRSTVAGKRRRERMESVAEWRTRLGRDRTAELDAWQKSHRFHPHQLRHAAATRFEREHDLDTCRALLGQRTLKAARIYAKLDSGRARDVMAKSG